MSTLWSIAQPPAQKVARLHRTIGCERVTATVLVNRGLDTADKAREFLGAAFNDLRPPFSIRDMDRAVNRIYQAVVRRERILIFGDYDVDGVTSTAVLLDFLQHLEARVSYYIPHRIHEGYGLKPEHISSRVLPPDTRLVITVDCGSGSQAAVAAARKAGIDVIITDHHSVGSPLPDALAFVNPKRPDCHAAFGHLAGVGVVFVLLIGLRRHFRQQGFFKDRSEPNLKQYCDLVALGTIADMVPLVGENRILARAGLELMAVKPRAGIQSLMEISGMQTLHVDAEDISFRMAPRINAAGRIKHAGCAVDLLTAPDLRTARRIAGPLDRMNTQRKILEKIILEQAEQQLKSHPDLATAKSLVLHRADWHPGVLGIVASRLVERYSRPVVLISTQYRNGKGSARSIPGIDLYQVLSRSAGCLMGFGGHAGAAGIEIAPAEIERFSRQFEATVCATGAPQADRANLQIDCRLPLDQISDRLIDELEQLKPFGMQNPEPLFMAQNVCVLSSKIVGERHRRMRLCQEGASTTRPIEAIWFNSDPTFSRQKIFEHLAYRLQWNRWNGRQKAQLVIAAA